MTSAARERARVRVPVLLVSAAGWTLAMFAPHGMSIPVHDSMVGRAAVSLELLLAHMAPGAMAAGWGLMLTGMMLPLLIAPLRHVRNRSFSHRRPQAIVLFIAGYAAVWIAAGALLLPLALAIRIVAGESALALGFAALAALVWQCSPFKQRCLNRAHAHPALAAAGLAAHRHVLCFGLAHGGWCVGSCWALMLLALLVPHGHLAGMAAISLWLAAERIEGPRPLSWRCRAPAKATRLLIAQTRMILRPT